MNNGAFGENFPYSNFHDLNMDWIIKIAKDFLDQYTHIQQIIADGETSIGNLTTEKLQQLQDKADALEALLQAWYNEHSEDIANQLAQALSDMDAHMKELIDSLPDDFNELVEQVQTIWTGMKEFDILHTYANFTDNKAVNTNGSIIDRTGCAVSDFIPTYLYNRLFITECLGSESYGFAFYTNKNTASYITDSFIPSYGSGDDGTGYKEFSIPANAKYVVVTFSSANANNVKMFARTTKEILNEEQFVLENFRDIADETGLNTLSFKEFDVLHTFGNFTDNTAINSNGNSVSRNGCAVSDFIPVESYNRLFMTESIGSETYGHAFYTEKNLNTYITGSFVASNGRGSDGTGYLEFNVPSTAKYVVVTFLSANANNVKMFARTKKDVLNKTDYIRGLYVFGNQTHFSDLPTGQSLILVGSFILDSQYVMTERQFILGLGADVEVQANGQILTNQMCTIDGLHFVGSWSPTRTTEGDHYAPLVTLQQLSDMDSDALFGTGHTIDDAIIRSDGQYVFNMLVRGCTFRNLDLPCISITGGTHRNKGSAMITNNCFSDCRMGVSVSGEFARLTSNTYYRTIIGVYQKAGNLCKNGEIFKGCDCAIMYPSGSGTGNNGHGESCGLEMAHSGIAGIFAKIITVACGDIYTGCHIVDSPIIAETANYLMITGGKLDTWVKIDAGANCAIMGNMVSVDYIGDHPLYTVPNSAYIMNNIPMRNTTYNYVNNLP